MTKATLLTPQSRLLEEETSFKSKVFGFPQRFSLLLFISRNITIKCKLMSFLKCPKFIVIFTVLDYHERMQLLIYSKDPAMKDCSKLLPN